MHNFEDKTCWKPIVRKYHASVSLSGKSVDILDVHNHVVASLTISIKFGKVALEDQISHSLIVIPVDGEAKSVSPFQYDADDNTIKILIMKTNGESQVFTASLEDLMKLSSNSTYVPSENFGHHHHGFEKPHCDFDKPHCDFDKHHFDDCFKPEHGKPNHDKDELDPGFTFDDRPCHDHKKDDWMNFNPEGHFHHKPLMDPYVTRSELLEESKKRQFNDLQIRNMIGQHKADEKTIFGHIDTITSALKVETERSKGEDKKFKEKLANLEYEFTESKNFLKNNDEELKKGILKEANTRENACSELFRLTNILQMDDTTMREKIENANAEIRKQTQILRSQDRDLHSEIVVEQNERVAGDKELKNLIRAEETARFNAVKEALQKVDIEYHRASIAEEEIKQELANYISTSDKSDAIIESKLETIVKNADKKYQEKGNYLVLNDKGIILENTDCLYIEGDLTGNVLIAKLGVANEVQLGDEKTALKLYGANTNPLYNGDELALVKEIPSLENYVQKESLNEALEQVKELQTQLTTQIAKYNDLEEKYNTLSADLYELTKKVNELGD